MGDVLDLVAGAIRKESERGRSHGQLAIELNMDRRVVCAIVRGERGIGASSLVSIMKADPPWLREVLAVADPQGARLLADWLEQLDW